MNNLLEKQQIFRAGSKTFYNSSRFFPEEVKKDISDLYAFVRIADDYVDNIPQDQIGFEKFKVDTYRALSGVIIDNQTVNAFTALCQKFQIERKWVELFLDSMESDLDFKPYLTFQDTLKYIYGSANVIGLMINRILKVDFAADIYAEKLGMAFQLINFVRDIDEDLTRNRNYFSQEVLHRFQLQKWNREYLQNNLEHFTAFIHSQIELYEIWQKEACHGLKYLPRKYRIPIKTASDMYMWTAQVIKKNPKVVFERNVKPAKLRIMLRGFYNILAA